MLTDEERKRRAAELAAAGRRRLMEQQQSKPLERIPQTLPIPPIRPVEPLQSVDESVGSVPPVFSRPTPPLGPQPGLDRLQQLLAEARALAADKVAKAREAKALAEAGRRRAEQ